MLGRSDEGFADRSGEHKRLLDRAQMVLNRRASGASIAVIAESLDMTAEDVQRILRRARDRSDARALSDGEALAKREDMAALAPAAERPALPRSFAAERAAQLCDRNADAWDRQGCHNAAAGMRHLADLWRHHGQGYPNYKIASDNLVRSMHHPNVEVFSYFSSPASACSLG